MERLVKEQYIPLTSIPMGEHHRLCRVLTASRGLLNLGVFGTASRKGGALRALIQPFSLCCGELYFDPVKKLWRLKEGQCLEVRESFHTNMNKYYAALFWADLIRKSHAGGGDEAFFHLVLDYLRNLDSQKAEETSRVFLLFIRRFLNLEGILPDRSECSRCGRPAPEGRALCYSPEGHIVCRSCRVENLPVLSPLTVEFLNQGEGPLSKEDLQSLKAYLLSILDTVFSVSMKAESVGIIFG